MDKQNSTPRACSMKSTATPAQFSRLLATMRTGPLNTYQLRAMGISHPAGRVRDLNRRGYVIVTSKIETLDQDGFMHRGVALYTLVSEPEGAHDE